MTGAIPALSHRLRPLLAAICLGASTVLISAPAQAQQNGGEVPNADTSKPIVIKTPKESKPKNVKFAGEVLSSTVQSITVRGGENERQVRTFTYGPEIRDKMQELFGRGGYQYGDKITIESQPNSDVALSIKGRPSKSL